MGAIHHGRLGGHRDGLRGGAELEIEIERDDGTDVHSQPGFGGGLEALHLDGEIVSSRGNAVKPVETGGGAFRGPDKAGGRALDVDPGTGTGH